MDDFEHRNPYENPDENSDENSESDGQANQGGIIDKARDVKDSAEDIQDKVNRVKEFRNKIRSGSEASKNVGKVATKTAGKEAVKGTVAASGAATAGIGTAVAAGIEVADRLNKKKKAFEKKVNDKIKEDTGIDVKKAKKRFLILFILLPILFFFFFLVAGTMFLGSESTYEDLNGIIQKREKRYAEPGKPSKSLLLMTDDEIDEILKKDYGTDDLCYKTYLKDVYNHDYDNFIPSDSNDPTSSYAEKLAIISKYLKAGRDNFNKITWKLEGSSSNLDVKDYKLVGKDSIFTDPGSLKMPDLDKYKSSPGMTQEQMKNMYIDMVYNHLQHWVIPYALNIASQNNDFGKSVLEDMWHKIETTLYELDRRTKTTTEKHYIKTKVDKKTVTYSLNGSSTHHDIFFSDTSVTYTGFSNDTKTVTYTVTKLRYPNGGYIPRDVESRYDFNIVPVDAPFRHVPKLTYVENLYNVITSSYTIKPIDENEPYVERSESLIDEDGTKIIVEIWDENLLPGSETIKKYKVSYISDDGYDKLNRPISRIEWYMDPGEGNYASSMYPLKDSVTKQKVKDKFYSPDGGITPPLVQGYSYDELTFGFTQIDKFYKSLKETANSGSTYGLTDVGNIPLDGFAWPVDLTQSPGSAVIGYLFGNTNEYNNGTVFHTGIDIKNGQVLTNSGALTIGPNIIASHNGKVIEAKMVYNVDANRNQASYGNVIKIETDDGKFRTVYGHLSSIAVTVGQQITRGQIIGTMGTTGNSSGVHLHYEIQRGILGIFRAVDPLLYYTTAPGYETFPNREATPIGYYRYTGSISSGLENTSAGGIVGFIHRTEGTPQSSGNDYIAFNDGAGYVTIGWGITWKDHIPQFNAAGIYSMTFGTRVSKSIVDNIEKQEIESRMNNIRTLLASNNITNLKEYQIGALLSRSYNVGNVLGFPAAWRTYGMTDGLWSNYFCNPVTANGVYMDGLAKRRAAEWELFTTGNYEAKIYDRW